MDVTQSFCELCNGKFDKSKERRISMFVNNQPSVWFVICDRCEDVRLRITARQELQGELVGIYREFGVMIPLKPRYPKIGEHFQS